MAFTFTGTPASLATLARNDLEAANTVIRTITCNIRTGEAVVWRTPGGASDGYYLRFNLYDGNDYAWRYIVGTENIPALLALKAAADANPDIQIVIYEPWRPYTTFYSMLGGVYSQASGLATLDAVYDPDATASASASLMLYGDRNTYNFTGTPTVFDEVLTGANGDDVLIGLLGVDSLYGGLGGDELYGGYGNDRLYGQDGNDFLYGEQNRDTLSGGDGDDLLDGGLGADTMIGGAGNDTYVVDNAGDIVTDGGLASDVDTVLIPSYLSYTLPANVENAELQGRTDSGITANALSNDLAGNAGANRIYGAAGADVIDGGSGNDYLIGGLGNDVLLGGDGRDVLTGGAGHDELSGGSRGDWFRFTAAVGQGIDTIDDFARGIDLIQISRSGFGGLGTSLAASQVVADSGKRFGSTVERFHFNTSTGALLFDRDGSGARYAPVQIATLLGVSGLTSRDFVLMA
jgi:Ca2+-binding RTX toxin-like protein